jgi:hypothetical protein
MENADDLQNILARLKPELGATLDGEPRTPAAKADEPAPEGKQWTDLGDMAGRVLIDDPQFQPENDHPAEDLKEFKPWRLQGGGYDEAFFALPRPRWPEPVAPMTPEIRQAYYEEMNLYTNAGGRLRRYFDWVRGPKRYLAALPPVTAGEPHYYVHDRQRYHDAAESAAQDLAWLTGLWESRGIPVLSAEELEQIKAVSKD